MKKILLLFSLLLLLTSCYDYHELNNLNIVNSIAIDYQENEYTVYLEIINSSKKDESNEYKTNIISGKSSNIATAFKNAINKSDKEIYLKQSRLLLLSEELCNKGINNIISYLLNDNTLSNNYILVTTNNINNFYQKQNNTKTTLNILNNNNEMDDIEKITSILINKHKDIALPYIEINNEKINTSKIAYFKEDKINNFIEKKLYDFLIKNNNNTTFSFDNNTITIYKKKIKTDIQKDIITININGYGYINQVNKNINLKDNDSYKILEKELNKQINDEITTFLNITLNNKSDLYGLQDLYYKKYQKENDNITYKINIDIKIDKNGNIYEGYYD